MTELSKGATPSTEVEKISPSQEAALAALRTGSTFREAAEVAGVARPTIYRWMQNDPHFRAAYNAWKLEQGESARGRLLKLADQAVDVIEASLNLNDRKAAVQVLKTAGALRPGRREATDPKLLKMQMDLRRFQDEYRAARAMLEHLLTKMGMSPADQQQFIRQHGVRTVADSDPRATGVAALVSQHAHEPTQAELEEAVQRFDDETTEETLQELSRASDEEAES